MSNLTKKAVIYCRTACSPQKGDDPAIERQEKLCRQYAEENGIEVLKVFSDRGTSDLPHLRAHFMAMSDFVRSYDEPLLVLMENYSRISRRLDEYKTHFEILHETYGAEIISVIDVSSEYRYQRAISEIKTDDILINVADMLQEYCDNSDALFHKVVDLLEERGGA